MNLLDKLYQMRNQNLLGTKQPAPVDNPNQPVYQAPNGNLYRYTGTGNVPVAPTPTVKQALAESIPDIKLPDINTPEGQMEMATYMIPGTTATKAGKPVLTAVAKLLIGSGVVAGGFAGIKSAFNNNENLSIPMRPGQADTLYTGLLNGVGSRKYVSAQDVAEDVGDVGIGSLRAARDKMVNVPVYKLGWLERMFNPKSAYRYDPVNVNKAIELYNRNNAVKDTTTVHKEVPVYTGGNILGSGTTTEEKKTTPQWNVVVEEN